LFILYSTPASGGSDTGLTLIPLRVPDIETLTNRKPATPTNKTESSNSHHSHTSRPAYGLMFRVQENVVG
jgi:hypothetical protein